MNVIQIYLPLRDNAGDAFASKLYADVEDELAEKFGGVTAYTRASARGLWREGGEVSRDEIILFEVIVPEADKAWWTRYRARLENVFDQDKILITSQAIEML